MFGSSSDCFNFNIYYIRESNYAIPKKKRFVVFGSHICIAGFRFAFIHESRVKYRPVFQTSAVEIIFCVSTPLKFYRFQFQPPGKIPRDRSMSRSTKSHVSTLWDLAPDKKIKPLRCRRAAAAAVAAEERATVNFDQSKKKRRKERRKKK
ncbi:hypothetical protein P5V15_008223 [Pogonomyrmex californicus]